MLLCKQYRGALLFISGVVFGAFLVPNFRHQLSGSRTTSTHFSFISGDSVEGTRLLLSRKHIVLKTINKVDDSAARVQSLNVELQKRVSRNKLTYLARPELDMYLKNNGVTHTDPVTIDDVLFFIKTSRDCKGRAAVARASWLRWAKHVYLVGDYDDSELGVIGNRNRPKDGVSYSRYIKRGIHQTLFINNLWRTNASAITKFKYVVYGDDDTWFNVPVLLQFIQPYNPDLKVYFSHLIIDEEYSWHLEEFNDTQPGLTWTGGGAGMVFTRAAFTAIAPHLYTPRCPWINHDDMLMSRCAIAQGVAQVHSEELDGHDQGQYNSLHTPFQV